MNSLHIDQIVYVVIILIAILCGAGVLNYLQAFRLLVEDGRHLTKFNCESAFASFSDGRSKATNIPIRAFRDLFDQISISPQSVSTRDILDSVSFEIESRSMFGKTVMSVIIFVALVGTLAGLSLGVENLSSSAQLSAGEPQAIHKFISEAKELLGSFGGAFHATIAGVFATILLFAADLMVTKRAAKFILELEKFLVRVARPYLFGKCGVISPDRFVTEIASLLRVMSADLPDAAHELRAFSRQAALTATRARELSDSASKSSTQLASSVGSLSELPTKLDFHLKQLEASHAKYLEAHREVVAASQAQAISLGEVATQVSSSLQRSVDVLDAMRSNSQETSDRTLAAISNLSPSLRSIEQSQSRTNQILSSFQSSVSSLNQAVIALSENIPKETHAAHASSGAEVQSFPNYKQQVIFDNSKQEEILRSIARLLQDIRDKESTESTVGIQEPVHSGMNDSIGLIQSQIASGMEVQSQILRTISSHLETLTERQLESVQTQLPAPIEEVPQPKKRRWGLF
jgi:hypothetical protein